MIPASPPAVAATPARFWRDMTIILLAGLSLRVAVLLVLPSSAISYDLKAWLEVAGFLAAGQNPYNLQPYLSWPPVWMQFVFLLDHLARQLGLPLSLVLRLFLIVADGAGVVLTGRLIRRLTPASMVWPLLLGWSLNPIAILLVCQHGNFDGLVAICVLALLLCLIEFLEHGKSVSWLWACGWLGVGVALKTVPMVLASLFGGGRRLPRRTLALGVALATGPALYGLSIIYVLGPGQVRAHVLGYRSIAGWFGISGLLKMSGEDAWLPVYRALFALALVCASALFASLLRHRLSPRGTVFVAAGLLAAVPALGPGYGAQYIAWFLPLLLVLWTIGDPPTRRVLLVFGLVAVPTYLLDYALVPSHGAFLLSATNHPTVQRLSASLATQRGSTLERLPLFAAYLLLVYGLLRAARRELSSSQTAVEP
jgi:hypothetical protein